MIETPIPLAAPWQPIETAERDDTPRLLLVRADISADHGDDEGRTEDRRVWRTFGSWCQMDQAWDYPGWCWCHDEWKRGRGVVIAWAPMPEIPAITEAAVDAMCADLDGGADDCIDP